MRKPILKTVSIKDRFNILGHFFKGYNALRDAVEVSSNTCTTRINDDGEEVVDHEPYITIEDSKTHIPGLHILEIYERFPCFDSYDYAFEDRYYRTFFFSKKPFTKEEIIRIASMKHIFYPQTISEWALPVVSRAGDSDKMIIAY